MKKIINSIILSFVTAYMLFFYEPIIMYSGNINDFNFDIYSIFPSLILITVFLTIFFTIIYLIMNNVCEKRKWNNVINILVLIHFAIFIVLYIHGNYLSMRLNILNGEGYIWNDYIVDMITSLFLILIIISFIVLGIKALGYKKTIRISKYITCTIFIMLTVALISSILKPKVLEKKEFKPVVTNKYLNTYSNDKNFIIYLVDAVDSKRFDKVRENSKYKDLFDDFTYYPDTMSVYSNTMNSVPQILTGMWNKNKYDYDDYSIKAYKQSPLLKELEKNKYEMNFYGDTFIMGSNELKKFSNFSFAGNKIDTPRFFTEELKYVCFKYFPYFLKQFININSLDFNNKNISSIKDDYYDWTNNYIYQYTKKNELEKVDLKQFKYIHTEGAHPPFDTDKNLNAIKKGTYEEKLESSLMAFKSFINKLKKNNLYDNSIIIFMADHGYNESKIGWGGQNPVFMVKGIQEKHKMAISNKKISYVDLMDVYKELLKGKKSDELFSKTNDDRIRTFLFINNNNKRILEEYTQKGKAWETDTLTKTGKIYKKKD